MSVDKLWLVGQFKGGQFPAIVWEFVGIFTTEDAALRACPDIDYFLVAVEPDVAAPAGPNVFEKVWYPACEERPY